MICPICKQEIKDNSKFCGKCGNIVPRCTTCGKVIDRKLRFCVYDGTPVPEEIMKLFPEQQEKAVVVQKKKRSQFPLIPVCVISLLVVGVLVIGYIMFHNEGLKLFDNAVNTIETENSKDTGSGKRLEESSKEDTEDLDNENEADITDDTNADDSEGMVIDESESEYIGNLQIDVEEQILTIREIYNDIVEEINEKVYDKRVYDNGVTAYFDGNDIKAIVIPEGTGENLYAQSFYYDTNRLIFAYYEADDAHRLYFMNDTLIRWRYSSDAENAQAAENHDLESSSEYEYWNTTAKEESDYYLQFVQYNEAVSAEDYILAGSDSRYLDKDELSGLNADECRLARNEIYARHGRVFDDEFLRTYFEQKDWYTGSVSSTEFNEDMLNEFEIYNRDLIVAYEKEMGYR